ncbi:XRE family transcriptional regulator [Silvimonas sp. JCM 19000]
MENQPDPIDSLDQHLAQRLKALRGEHAWSLDELSRRSGISRATLSRLENAEVSPTASVLGKLCAAYGLTVSRLMRMVEAQFQPLIRPEAQALWSDPQHGFRRRSVSPPAATLAGEALLCELEPDTHIRYEASPRPGLEHHLLLQEGQLRITVDGHTYDLQPGDCLRYQLHGASAFDTPADSGARYYLFIV